MRGRKPKPENLRLYDNQVRVIGSKDPPNPPEWLDGDSRKEWDRLIPELAKRYVITPLDAASLAAYCRTYALWMEADKDVVANGLTFRADNGNVRCNPIAKLSLSLFEALRRMGAEFGLTPASRARLAAPIPETEEGDAFDRFLEA